MSSPETDKIRFEFAQIGSVNLHYAAAGNGSKLIILLHGFPEFWYSWRHQLTALADEYTVVAPDMRGYNLSDKPAGVDEYEVRNLVDDIAGLISYLGFDSASVAGHDWGAAVSWELAGRYPDRVSKLVCLQVPPPSIWKKNQSVRQLWASWYMFFFQIPRLPEWLLSRNNFAALAVGLRTTTVKNGVFTEQDISEYKNAWGQPGAITAAINYYRANILKRLFSKSELQDERRIKVPTLFIYGEKDHAVLPQTVKGVGRFIDAEYAEFRIPDSGHWVQIEAKEKVTEALKNFFNK